MSEELGVKSLEEAGYDYTKEDPSDLVPTVAEPLTPVACISAEDRAEAYRLYMHTNLSMEEIAAQVDVPLMELVDMAISGKWKKKRQSAIAEITRRADEEFKQVAVKERLTIMKRHVDLSGKLEQTIDNMLNEIEEADLSLKDKSMLIKRLAESLSSSSGVGARAVGITEKGINFDQAGDGAAGKVPLVSLNVAPAPVAPGKPEPKPIDV